MEDRFPTPNQERLCAQRPAFLQGQIQNRELHDKFFAAVFVRYEREHWEHRVNGGVAEDEEAIVNGDRYKIKDDRENGLNNCDDEPSVNNKLTQGS